MPRLSCCLIAKNEALDLPRCLASTAGLDAELIVVDTGSTDRTPEIAAEFGARVLNHVWRKDFSAARNVGLEAATGDWILSLDADDELPPETIAALPELLARADGPEAIDGFTMIYRSFMPPDEVLTYTEMPVLRLFRNRPIYRYRLVVHEQILPALQENGGRTVATDLRILHHGYASPTAQGGVDRNERDRRILTDTLSQEPDNASLLFQLGGVALRQGSFVEARQLLERALSVDEHLGPVESALTTFYLSSLALKAGNPTQALAYAESSVRASTHSSPSLAHLNIASAHLLLGQAATAAAANAMKPDLPPSAYAEALRCVQVSREHFAAAREAYVQVIAAPDVAPTVRSQAQTSFGLVDRMLR